MEVRRGSLFALFGANAISMTGNAVALVAIPWFVLITTGSAARTGLTAAMSFLPVVLANFFGGAFVDRLGARRASVLADLASALPVAAIPLLHSTVGIEFWQLLTLVFLGALLDAPGTTARASLLPEAVQDAGWRMERATGVYAVVERGARLVGAPVAGIGIAALGASNVLWLDAASFLISAALITGFVPRPRAEESEKDQTPYLEQLAEGWRFLHRDRVMAAMIYTVTITNLIDAAAGVILISFAERVYGDAVSLGLILGAMAGGSVLGALAYSAVGHRFSRRALFGWGFVIFSGWHLVFAIFPPLWVALVMIAISGFAAGPINPVIDTIAYERVPKAMRGRVFGVMMSLAWMAVPLGALLGGLSVAALGLRITLLITGSMYLLTTIGLQLLPALKEMDRPAAAREPDHRVRTPT